MEIHSQPVGEDHRPWRHSRHPDCGIPPLDHHLLLEHEYDGRDLEMNYATETLRYCAGLWKGKVTLKTRLNREERIIHCDEGSNLSILL